MRGMPAQLLTQPGQFGIDVALLRRAAALALGRWDVKSGGSRAQRRREIAPYPRIAVFDPLRQRHRAERLRRTRVISRRNPSRPTVFSEHERARVVAVAVGLQHDSQAAATAMCDRDYVTAPQ